MSGFVRTAFQLNRMNRDKNSAKSDKKPHSCKDYQYEVEIKRVEFNGGDFHQIYPDNEIIGSPKIECVLDMVEKGKSNDTPEILENVCETKHCECLHTFACALGAENKAKPYKETEPSKPPIHLNATCTNAPPLQGHATVPKSKYDKNKQIYNDSEIVHHISEGKEEAKSEKQEESFSNTNSNYQDSLSLLIENLFADDPCFSGQAESDGMVENLYDDIEYLEQLISQNSFSDVLEEQNNDTNAELNMECQSSNIDLQLEPARDGQNSTDVPSYINVEMPDHCEGADSNTPEYRIPRLLRRSRKSLRRLFACGKPEK